MQIKLSQQDTFRLAMDLLNARGFKVENVSQDGNVFVLDGDRVARQSGNSPYVCKHDWPIAVQVQCGDDGMVFPARTLEGVLSGQVSGVDVLSGKQEHYKTAFFEAFPRDPQTFIRGEGQSIEEAESKCWESYQRILSCPKHDFERRDRDDGYCFCKHCGLSGMFMQPLHPCRGCKATEYELYGRDKDGNGHCKTCYKNLPEEQLSDFGRALLNIGKQK